MMIVMKLMSLWLILSLSAAAPLNPIVEKEAPEDNLITEEDIVRFEIVNGDDMDIDGIRSHISQNTARDPKLTFYAGDVILSGNIDIDGDHAHIASIITNDVSESRSSALQDGGWSEWSGYSSCSCGSGTKTRERTCTEPAPTNGGAPCPGSNKDTVDCNYLPDCGCPTDEIITSECMCGGNSCAQGSVCTSGSTCTPGCAANETITSECICGGNSCPQENVCNVHTSGSTCTPGCSADAIISSACMCGCASGSGVCESCASGSLCASGLGCTSALRAVVNELTAAVQMMKGTTFSGVDQVQSSEETAIINSIDKTKEYLDKCTSDITNITCESTKIWPLTKELKSTFQTIQYTNEVSSSFLNEYTEKIESLATQADNVKEIIFKALRDIINALESTANKMKDMMTTFPEVERNESSDEITIINSIAEAKVYLDWCARDIENIVCESTVIGPFTKELTVTFNKIHEDGKVSSKFPTKFNEGIQPLTEVVDKVQEKIEPSIEFTVCNSDRGCACETERCAADQICQDGKCINVCAVSAEVVLTDECFCLNNDEGHLCAENSLCTEHGCMLDTDGGFFFFLFG